jgi:hypothetical protein
MRYIVTRTFASQRDHPFYARGVGIMHPEMARILVEPRHRELTRQAGQWRATASPQWPRRHAASWRVPHYRVRWSRIILSPADVTGRRERSWVIVISATRGL